MISQSIPFIGVACVKNEADIIEAFVRHNLAYLDRLLVLDHGSSDDTHTILQALQKEGLALQIFQDHSLGKFQGEKMTFLMQQAAQQGAVWVVLLDGDELIKTHHSKLPVPPEDGPGVMKVSCVTYTAHPSDDLTEVNPILRLRHRLASEPGQNLSLKERQGTLKALVRGDVALRPDTTVLQGNHEVLAGGLETGFALCRDWSLAHYSLRSPSQYASKVIINALQKLCRGSMTAHHSSFYIRHLELIRADYQGYVTAFPNLLPAYIEKTGHQADKVSDPLHYRGGALRYTSFRTDTSQLITNLLEYSEAMARRLGLGNPEMIPTRIRLSLVSHPDDRLGRVDQDIEPLAPQVLELPFPESKDAPISAVEWRGPIGLVELREIHLTGRDGTKIKLSGLELLDVLDVSGDARLLPHDQYFTFIKEIGPAILELQGFFKIHPGPWNSLGFTFIYYNDPATVGTRFIQSRPLAAERLNARLEKKIAQLVTLRGFIREQIILFRRRFLKDV